MAVRVEKAFGGDAEMWMSLQTAYDLAASPLTVAPLPSRANAPPRPPPAPARPEAPA